MKINDIIRKTLVKYPMFGSIIANTTFIENQNIETACTNGEYIMYNPLFLEQLTQEEQIFIFAHEVSHIALDHIARSKNRDIEVWNLATDAVINANLMQDGLVLPKIGGINIPDAINHDAEEMYDKLLKQKEKLEELMEKLGNIPNDLKKQIFGGSSPFDQKTHASHKTWSEGVSNINNNEQSKDSSEGANSLEPSKSKKEETIDKCEKLGEKETFKQNQMERKKQLEELKKSLMKGSFSCGNESGGFYLNVSEIGIGKPLIDWRVLLREATNYKIDWSYKNATIENGVLTPHLEEEMVPETEIVLDTSGSINETLLKNFLRECKNILPTSIVKVGCFDTKFYGFHLIRNFSDIDNMKYEGGGGTDFDVAVSAFSKRVDNKIIFTDGYADMPREKVKAIWVVFGNTKINPNGGKVIYIDKEQFDKLSYEESNKIKKL